MRFKILFLIFLLPLGLLAGYPHKSHSVLQSGKWFRISLQKSGIYKITYEDLVVMGFNVASLDPARIGVYGNGMGMLPESNAISRPDDLVENAIIVRDGGDGKMDPGDYILFYGESPDKWILNYSTRVFTHSKNIYADSSYYYVTIGTAAGKRVQQVSSLTGTPDTYSMNFTDCAVHDIDSVNLIQSGKTWVGEVFSVYKNSCNVSFSFPNLDSLTAVRVVTHVVAKSSLGSSFLLTDHKSFNQTIHIGELNPASDLFARDSTKTSYLLHPKSPIDLTLTYSMNESNANGWLDYIEVICQRKLAFSGPQMLFRDPNTVNIPITEFRMTKTNPDVVIWDVTQKGTPAQIIPVSTDSTLRFRVATDSLKEFIAFDGSSFLPVNISGPVANQDLHGLSPTNLVIVTPSLLREQADSLADFHRTQNGLTVAVVDIDQIFTEFGSGQRDITAIRDFMKMIYDKGYPDNSPRYLLLFGDGTYDPKNRIAANNNMIPPYESNEYLFTTASYVSDDYYGIMGDTEGNNMNGSIEIGIGRMPISTMVQARDVVNKIKRYSSLNDSTMSDWRNTISFVADDPNTNLHLQQAERLADTVKNKYPVFNVKKIYNDAYRFSPSPSGLRSPDCEKAINQTIQDGTIVFSYTGHGGEDGWSATKILTVTDINSWTNNYRLPVFLTATCEFSRFDNPNRPTGGELVITKPNGGGIAIFTTTRKAFASTNIELAASFFSHLKSVTGDANQKMGDLMRIVKNENGNNVNIRNFVLLGDPAQDIAFPLQQAVTTSINNHPSGPQPDTLFGMSKVTVRGEIRDGSGNKMGNYSGILFPKVFDKPVTYTTIGNTSDSYPQNFKVQDKLLFAGRTTVTNGDFEFTFVVPKGIGLSYGNGKISYYSRNHQTDAGGFDPGIIIGGENTAGDTVTTGPRISLYMDNTSFVSGGKTGRNPSLLAYLNDPCGINNMNLGIGHDIIGVLDNDDSHAIGLNDYYVPDTNSYSSGSVLYPFTDLATGFHSLLLKAWNVHDISSEKEIFFWVSDPQVPSVQQVKNFPNPVREGTTFVFSSMNISGDVNVQILIYTYTGQLIKTIQKKISETTAGVQLISWDANGENGQPLGSGIYPYRVILKGSDGSFAQASQKLVIVR
ncbi:MAG: type IX secretion system sortase PorU [Bacteroidetes bacterium]|nr:type IX secretion system sortase PorU [Bacteroidota bacterium]